MKPLFKLTLFAAFCAFTTASFSQISFGAKAGFNLANVMYSQDELDPKFNPTFQVGAVVEIGITEQLAVQTGLGFQGKGTKLKEDILGEELESTTNLYYLQVPAHLLFNGDMFFVGAGPYAAFCLSGKSKSTFAGESDTEDLEIGNTVDDDVASLDFGIGAQAGVKLGSLRIGAGYDLGLANIIPKDAQIDDESIKNGVISVFVTYMFGGGDE